MAVTPQPVAVSSSVPTLTLAAGSTGGLNTASTIDPVNDYLPIYTASATATQGINRNTYLGLSSAPVGLNDTQTLNNKTLVTPIINGGTISGTLTGSYTLGGTPTFPASVVTLTGTQVMTNKTLTSPTLNSATLNNAIVYADSISGYTASTTGTIFGISVSSGTLPASAIPNNSITGSKIASYNVTRSNNGTTTSETAAKILSGWSAGQPGVAAGIAFTITFPTAFTNPPIVMAVWGGDTAGTTSTLGSGDASVKGIVTTQVGLVTTTGCIIRLRTTDSTTWSAGNTVYVHWTAIGV